MENNTVAAERKSDNGENKVQSFVMVPTAMLSRLHELTGVRLSIWMAYRLRENKETHAAWASLKTLAQDTGFTDRAWLRKERAALIEDGWLVRSGLHKGSHGGSPIEMFRAEIPSSGRETQPLRNSTSEVPSGRETLFPSGRENRPRTIRIELKEKPWRQTPPQGAVDPRFKAIREAYICEFEKRAPGLKAPFDGSDGKALKSLLAQQDRSTAEELIAMLVNAFNSDRPPLPKNFRLRAWCVHFASYRDGALTANNATAQPVWQPPKPGYAAQQRAKAAVNK